MELSTKAIHSLITCAPVALTNCQDSFAQTRVSVIDLLVVLIPFLAPGPDSQNNVILHLHSSSTGNFLLHRAWEEQNLMALNETLSKTRWFMRLQRHLEIHILRKIWSFDSKIFLLGYLLQISFWHFILNIVYAMLYIFNT